MDPTFEIQQSEFDIATSPNDLRGRLNVRVDNALQREIEDIAENVQYPLNSVSEVVRFCCLRGLEYLRQWKPEPTLLGTIKAASALLARDKIQCETIDLLDKLDERVQWYIANGFYDEVIELVAQIRAHFDNVGGFWSKHIQKEIDLRFSTWMGIIDGEREKSETCE